MGPRTVTVNLTASNPQVVYFPDIYYSVDSAPEVRFIASQGGYNLCPIEISKEGVTTITFTSVIWKSSTSCVAEEAGYHTVTVSIDTIAPVTTNSAVQGKTLHGRPGVHAHPTDVSGSGVASTWFKLDSGAWTSGTLATVLAPTSGSASHTIQWYSIDVAGNTEGTKSVTFDVQASSGHHAADDDLELQPGRRSGLQLGPRGHAVRHGQLGRLGRAVHLLPHRQRGLDRGDDLLCQR